MAVIETQITRDCFYIDIKIDKDTVSSQEDIETLRDILKCKDATLSISSNHLFTITDNVFERSDFQQLTLTNIILSREALLSITHHLYSLRTNHDQPYLNELSIQELIISPQCTEYNVPSTIKELSIFDCRDITINCHDQLESFSLCDKATLVNCNNLKLLTMGNTNSRAYGEFLNYISHVRLQYHPWIIMNNDITCEYLSMFYCS